MLAFHLAAQEAVEGAELLGQGQRYLVLVIDSVSQEGEQLAPGALNLKNINMWKQWNVLKIYQLTRKARVMMEGFLIQIILKRKSSWSTNIATTWKEDIIIGDNLYTL